VTQVLQELAELQGEQKYVLWMYPSAQPSLQELRMEKSAM